jgi:NAD(P)-dependent dehydrogenase (short-subunit alcohol dehydrogenase family)
VRLSEKVALITGSSPNINAGIAYGLAEEGARIVCVDIDPRYAEACAQGIRNAGGDAISAVCDVTDAVQVANVVEQAVEAYGQIDILVNGAVQQIRKGVLTISPAEFRRQLDIVLTGSLLFTSQVAERLIEAGRPGSIINIGSTEGHQGNPGNIGYSTAKGGLLQFTRAAAMELAVHRIRVNSLTPTGTDPTEGEHRAAEWGVDWVAPKAVTMGDTEYTHGTEGMPLGQRPSPRHYARAAVFLASEDSEMITGSDLRVDGGVVSRYWRWHPGMKRATT